jgi:hypothetical protein
VTRRSRLLLALLALPLAWLLAPGAVPLYDGISAPDEPYRYVLPPAGYHKTPPPLSAKASVAVADGTNGSTLYVNTDEFAPQVAVVLPKRLVAAASARTVTVSLTPLAPDHQPSKGSIDGNVYRVSASAGASWAPPPGDAVTESQITMRATSAKRPIPTFVYRPAPAEPWKVVHTYISGNDIYSAQFAGFGDYALVFGAVAASGQGSSMTPYVVSGLLALVLLAAGLVAAVRLSRRHQGGEAAP